MQNNAISDQNVIDEVERTKWKRTGLTLLKDWRLYVLLIPIMLFLILFKYLPIRGILYGFRWNEQAVTGQVSPSSEQWCGFIWVQNVFNGAYSAQFWQAFRNTFVNSMYGLIFGFPIPIFLALCFSEIKNMHYRSVLQVCAYLPHFISTVVITQLIRMWCQNEVATQHIGAGLLYKILDGLNLTKSDGGVAFKETGVDILSNPKFFRPIYQVSGVWEGAGYGSIVYFAAILAISPTSYEAARSDGATKMQQIRYVTIPGMAPTLVIMLIMRIGRILNIGYEKIILLVNDKSSSFVTADVLSTLVYRMSGKGASSDDTAKYVQMVGIVMDLFNSLLAMVLVIGANAISRRVSDSSLF
jgi:putative aldouronate transport system permease protein